MMEANEHNVITFDNQTLAYRYLLNNKLSGYLVYGLRCNGNDTYHVAQEEREEKGIGVTETLSALYDECKESRDVFIAAAEILGFKKGTATTYWYNFKKERG